MNDEDLSRFQDEGDCPHPEVKLGKHLLNKDLSPEQIYCLACGEAISE